MIGYKYEIVASKLREAIEQGDFPTGKLPDEQALMEQFNVGKITVYNALKHLTTEGIIRRVKSRGTFINGSYGKTLTIAGQVAVIMKHQGHYYSDLSRYIWDNLRTYNKFAVPVDYKQRDCDKVFPQFKEHLYLLLNSNIYGVIFSGYNYSQFPFMDDFQNLRSVMIDYYDRAGDNPFNSVLVDFKQAAYLVTRHVIESGCKRPVLFRHQPDHLYSSDDETNHPAYQLENGYHTAMLEHDIDSNSEVIIRQKINLEDQIRGILSRRQAPDAIICNSDNVAVKVINVALAMGLKVPDDIAVTGMYNTPWTEECQVKITSVSLEESSTAKEAVRILNSDAKEKIHLKTQPKLIIREST